MSSRRGSGVPMNGARSDGHRLQTAPDRSDLGPQFGQCVCVTLNAPDPPQQLARAEPEHDQGDHHGSRSHPPPDHVANSTVSDQPPPFVRAEPTRHRKVAGTGVQPAAYPASAERAAARMSSASHGGESTVTAPDELSTRARTHAGSDTRRLIWCPAGDVVSASIT